jgi:hypothetical protein
MPLSKPITGVAGCCARAASGHAAAALPSSVGRYALTPPQKRGRKMHGSMHVSGTHS